MHVSPEELERAWTVFDQEFSERKRPAARPSGPSDRKGGGPERRKS